MVVVPRLGLSCTKGLFLWAKPMLSERNNFCSGNAIQRVASRLAGREVLNLRKSDMFVLFAVVWQFGQQAGLPSASVALIYYVVSQL